MDKILNFLALTPAEEAAFRAAAPDAEQLFQPISDNRDPAVPPEEHISSATVILGNPVPGALAGAGQLKWLQTWSAGVDPYLRPGVLQEGVALTSAVGAYGQGVSEHLFSMLLCIMKQLHLYRDNQFLERFDDLGAIRTLDGATVLIAGTGDLGSAFARLVKAMGACTVGLRRDPSKGADGIDEMHALTELDDLLPTADVVALNLPHTPETYHLMDARRLALMKSSAILVNAGRGTAIDCMALADALHDGKLWGAGLDVTEPEPLSPGHPLWHEPRVLITPHVAGGLHLEQTARRIAAIALENLGHYLAGEPLRNRMN